MISEEDIRYGFSYTRKDLILYALSLGFGSSSSSSSVECATTDDQDADDDDLRFLYECHPYFTSIPLFCLTFTFWATEKNSNNRHERSDKASGDRRRRLGDTSSGRIPSFPPPLMSQQPVIPVQCLVDSTLDLSQYPVIHTCESIRWEQTPPVPMKDNNNDNISIIEPTVDIVMDRKTISVQPKSIGTFVTSQSTVRRINCLRDGNDDDDSSNSTSSILCTIESTVVILGLSSDLVSPLDTGISSQSPSPTAPSSTKKIGTKRKNDAFVGTSSLPPTLEWTYTPARNQALLYRMASGDTNHIHVDTSVWDQMGKSTHPESNDDYDGTTPKVVRRASPLLHGLFTLGVAFRGILKVCPDADQRIQQVEGRFTNPAFVGDTLMVRVWKTPDSVNDDDEDDNTSSTIMLFFQVIQKDSGVILVDSGRAILRGIMGTPTTLETEATTDRRMRSKL